MNTIPKFTLITGATSGIGYELARLFAAEGNNLVIVARTQSELEKVAVELQRDSDIKVIPISRDLFNPENAFDLCEDIKARGIFIENLINDAGQGQYGEFVETDILKELDIIQLNIASLVVLTKFFLREMVKKGEGRILNVSSVGSKSYEPLQAVYHATKSFVQSFTEAVREEVKDSGVTVTALLPGATDTNFFRKADMLYSMNAGTGELASPAQVARDGYAALMNGEEIVVSVCSSGLSTSV